MSLRNSLGPIKGEIDMKNRRILFTILCGIMLLAGGASGAYAQERPEVNGELRTLSGRIRWNKAMGVLPKTPRGLEPADNICAQFFVVVTQPSTRSEKPIQYDIALEAKPEPSKPDYYSCAFEMKVPSNVLLNVHAGMGDGLAWPNSGQSLAHYVHPWIVSGLTTKVRSKRMFTPAKREIRLGNKGMFITFELVYEQQQ
jgi:hypothetical protein